MVRFKQTCNVSCLDNTDKPVNESKSKRGTTSNLFMAFALVSQETSCSCLVQVVYYGKNVCNPTLITSIFTTAKQCLHGRAAVPL